MARSWLIAILVFLPFQLMCGDLASRWSSNAGRMLRYVDEITIIVMFPVAAFYFVKNIRSLTRYHLILIAAVLVVVGVGILSSIVNRIPLLISSLGIFDYVKNFLVIFIYAATFSRKDDFSHLFKYPLYTAVFIGLVAVIQELWALMLHYALGYNINYSCIYILRLLPQGPLWGFADLWRFGIYRAPSFMHHQNSLGLYSLLVLTLYLFTTTRVNRLHFTILYSSIFFSVSRMIYSAFALVSGVQFVKGRYWIALFALPIVVFLCLMVSLPDMPLVKEKDMVSLSETPSVKAKEADDGIFRVYAKGKAFEVWRDHPLLGAGPGMFGGVISMTFNSPIYKDYNFSQKWFDFMTEFRSLDQFWPQILAEIGLMGTVAFGCVLLCLLYVFASLRRRASSRDLVNLFSGLLVSTMVIIIYSFGSGLNNTPFLFTLSAISGIGLNIGEDSTCK